MSRQRRENVAGETYHITARGNNREPIFTDDADRFIYLRLLATTARLMAVRLFAYVLMTNHVHLLLGMSQPNLSAMIHRLHLAYATYFNRRHGRWGHLFGRRFFSEPVTDDTHLLGLSRYLHRNPVRAGLVDDPTAYPWSSCWCYIGLHDNTIVDTQPVLELLSRNPARATGEFVKLVRERGWQSSLPGSQI